MDYRGRELPCIRIGAQGSRKASEDQRSLVSPAGFYAMMLDAPVPVVTQKIKTQAVMIRLVGIKQLFPEIDPLRRIDPALEDGVLYALTVVEAYLGDAT